jgi:small GTP-binding protein
VEIWKRLRENWRGWRWNATSRPGTAVDATRADGDAAPLLSVQTSLRGLLQDRRVPDSVREELAGEYEQLEAMLERLEHGHLHIAAVGRVSVGKSSLLNALLGRPAFSVSPLHGETRRTGRDVWRESDGGHVFLIDTPGIDEVAGEDREAVAFRAADTSDVVLFVVDGDLTRSESAALTRLCTDRRPVLLVLNKADRYTADERAALLARLREHAAGRIAPEHVVAVSAAPSPRTVIRIADDGSETECRETPPPELTPLVEALWALVESEGRALAAINAGLFAGRLSDQVAARITALRRDIARRVTDNYALGKGIAVAVNPVPLADLAGAAALDVSLIVHLSHVYGLPVTRREAGRLVAVTVGQLSVLMGAFWSVNLFASALKVGTLGLSTALTATAQGAVGYAGTWVLGRVAEDYFRRGGSWGPDGPKQAVQRVLDGLDRDSLLSQARADIRRALRQ